MIDRKAFWISVLVLVAMIAADFWRLSLLVDPHHFPTNGPGSHAVPAVMVYIPVLSVLFTMVLVISRKLLRSGSEEAVQRWGRWLGLMLLFNTAISALAEAFMLARSLGALQYVNPLIVSHAVFVATGIFMMVIGNMVPKLPWLSQRFSRYQLDPWQWNRLLRFGGKVMVGLGLFFAVVMPLLPFMMIVPAALGVTLATLATNYWYRAKVRREPSPQP